MTGISIRKFIKWFPDEASEPTSTLVLTSPERRYVDIRILLPDNGKQLNDEEEFLPIDQLDWGIAGTSASEAFPDGHSHSRWSHWIDSRTVDAEAASDEGDMYAHADDPLLTLEKGRMVNPATGKETDYEEMWFDPPPKPAEGGITRCLVLQMEGGKNGASRGLFVRLGEWAQVIVRDGPEQTDVVAERWEWRHDGRGWRRRVRLSNEERELPCERLLREGGFIGQVGDEVAIRDEVWRVVEAAEL